MCRNIHCAIFWSQSHCSRSSFYSGASLSDIWESSCSRNLTITGALVPTLGGSHSPPKYAKLLPASSLDGSQLGSPSPLHMILKTAATCLSVSLSLSLILLARIRSSSLRNEFLRQNPSGTGSFQDLIVHQLKKAFRSLGIHGSALRQESNVLATSWIRRGIQTL